MKKIILLFSMLILMSTDYAYGQIGNDYCTGAYEIPLMPQGQGVEINGDLMASSASFTLGNICGDHTNNDLWYKFTATSSQARLSSFSTVHFLLYEDICSSPNNIRCMYSNVIFDTEVGQSYYIRVLQLLTTTTAFSFTLDAYTGDVLGIPNDYCDVAIPAPVGTSSCGTTMSYSNGDANQSIVEANCGSNTYKDAWYTVTAPPSGTIKFTPLAGSYNSIALYNGDCTGLNPIRCDINVSEEINFYELDPNANYYLRLLSSQLNNDTKEFCLTEGLPSTNINCTSAEIINITTNDTITLEGSFENTNSNPDTLCPSFFFNSSNEDFWYEFTMPESGNISLENYGSTVQYSIYSGSCTNLNVEICKEVLYTQYISDLIPNETYYLRIFKQYSYHNDEFSVGITSIENPVNNNCDGAIPITIETGACTLSNTTSRLGSTFSGEQAPCSDDRNDAWFTFEATHESIEIFDSSYDIGYALYTGSCGDLVPFSCGKRSVISGLIIGETYYLQTQGFGSNYDICISAKNITNPTNSTCTGATEIISNTSLNINLEDAGINTTDVTDCTYRPHDLWYKFTATNDNLKISCPQYSRQNVAIYKGGSCNLLEGIQCYKFVTNDKVVFGDLILGDTYYIQIYDIDKSTNFNTYTFDFEFIESPTNDDCQQAKSINTEMNIFDNVENASLTSVPLPNEEYDNVVKDLWYEVSANNDGIIEIENRSTNYLQAYQLYTALYNLDCNQPSLIDYAIVTPDQNKVYFDLIPSAKYHLRLLTTEESESVHFRTKEYSISNSTCADAQPIILGVSNCVSPTTAELFNAYPSGLSNSCFEGNDLFYQFTMPESSDVIISQINSDVSHYSVYSQECDELIEIDCFSLTYSGSKTIANLIEDQTYTLQISGTSATEFCAYIVPEISTESMCESAVNITESSNESCENMLVGTTDNAGQTNGSFCGTSQANAAFYSFTPSLSSYYTLEISDAAADHKIGLYENCTLQTTIACGQSKISTMLDANTEYIVAIYPSISGVTSGYNFCVYNTPETLNQNIGISTQSPQTKLDINGGVKPGFTNVEIAGNIRWNGDLQVYDGIDWSSLTKWDHSATQNINMNGKSIINLTNPVNDYQAATKKYVDDHNDGDNDSTNEIETWSTLDGIPTDFSDNTDDVDDADSDPTNEIETWSTLAGMPADFADNTDDVDDADSDPTNEIDTWSTLAGIPTGFTDNTDDVDDADSDPTNEIETWSTLAGIPTDFADDTDNVDDADNDPTNEIDTWSTLAGIPADFSDNTDDVDDADSDPTNEIETWSTLAGIPTDFADNTDDVDDADSDPTNEIETWSTLAGIPTDFADNTDDVDDADSDPTNEIDTWSTLAGIPADFSDNTDDVDDADSDPTNEIETWSTLAGIPVEFADNTDDVDDADNDPTNEIETWSTLAGIPTDFADDTDDVDDADNDPNNEKITNIELDGTEIIITESGTEHLVDLDQFTNLFERSGTTIKNINSINDDFLFGATTTPVSGNVSQSFLLFDESKAAFRVGYVANSTRWNEANLGLYSFGTGYNTLSSGFYSAAFNKDTKAEASYSTAIGRYNEGGGSVSVWSSNDPLFEIGIGTSSIPRNAMTVLKSGRVGIGDSSPDALLQLSNDGTGSIPQLSLTEQSIDDGARINFKNENTTTNKWTLFGKPDNTAANSEFNLFHTSTGNILTARGNGDVGIGGVPDMDFHLHHGNSGTSSGMKLENNNNGTWIRMYVSSGSGDLRFYSENQGTSIIGAIDDVSGTYTALSDKRTKKDFKELHFDWQSFMKLHPLTYRFIKAKDDKPSIGMIAQEVNEIYPELIKYHEENDLYHMDYSGVGVIAVKAVQELKKENELLKEQLKLVMERLEKLEDKK